MQSVNENWFERNPVTTILLVLVILVVLIEISMHALYWTSILPRNALYMTQLEKADYRKNINQITYEDNVPRRGEGYATYMQRGIPPQYIEFDQNGMRVDSYHGEQDMVIGVFGDSYTDALQVGQLEAYPALLEIDLRDSGCDVDVRNYGIGATGTSVHYLRYKQRKSKGERFDLVILTLFQNDIINNQPELDLLFPKSYVHYPYFRLDDGKLSRLDWHAEQGKQVWENIEEFLHKYSHIANTIFNIKQIYHSWENTQLKKKAGDELLRIGKRTEMDNLYGPPQSESWRKAWDVTEALIAQWYNEAIADNEKFLLVILTEPIQLKPGATGDLDIDYPNRRLTEFANEMGIEILDFLPVARREVISRNMEFPYLSWKHDGHYSQIGHKLLTSTLGPKVQKIISCENTR